MCNQQSLAAALLAGGRHEFEGPAAVGVGAAAGVGHGVVAAVDWVGDLQDTTPRPSEGGPPVRYFGLRASRSGIGLSEEWSMLSMPSMLPDERALARGAYRNFKCSGF
jgi:hypothetical protein